MQHFDKTRFFEPMSCRWNVCLTNGENEIICKVTFPCSEVRKYGYRHVVDFDSRDLFRRHAMGAAVTGARVMEQALDRPLASDDVRAKRRAAFAWAYSCVASEGLPPPTEFALRVREWVIDGQVSFDEAAAMLIRHHTGRTQA